MKLRLTIFTSLLMLFAINNSSFAAIEQSDILTFNCAELKTFSKTGNKNKDLVKFAERLKKRKCK